MDSGEIRSRFLDYYQGLGFQLLPRASLLHPSIPMSFVMSAGLVQVETSLAQAENRSGDKFILVQDCFRHFDLDIVGTDDIHLSLFEMPGAFIFSNNGKQHAIQNMWHLATNVLGINPDRIWASYFSGDNLDSVKLDEDEVTQNTWLDIGLSETRLIGLGINHNYWIQGKSVQHIGKVLRKCGPNTELFYDLGSEQSCSANCKPGCKCGRFIEFANSLFISHEICPRTNKLNPMADPFIETVIGTERVAMILQGVKSVFNIVDYRPLIHTIRDFTTCKTLPQNLINSSEKVIADYIRALCFLVVDGAPPPGKNGRERIIKLLIRGILTRQIILGIKSKEFIPELIHSVMGGTDKSLEIVQTERTIKSFIEAESHRFNKTIERGYRELALMLKKNNGKTISGKQILQLEKNFGLPHLLIETMLWGKKLSFNEKEYKDEIDVWKETTIGK